MSSLATGLVPGAESLDYTKAGNMIEVMYKFQSSTWNELVDKMPKLESVVNNTMSEVSHLNNFLGVRYRSTSVESSLQMLWRRLRSQELLSQY